MILRSTLPPIMQCDPYAAHRPDLVLPGDDAIYRYFSIRFASSYGPSQAQKISTQALRSMRRGCIWNAKQGNKAAFEKNALWWRRTNQ